MAGMFFPYGRESRVLFSHTCQWTENQGRKGADAHLILSSLLFYSVRGIGLRNGTTILRVDLTPQLIWLKYNQKCTSLILSIAIS